MTENPAKRDSYADAEAGDFLAERIFDAPRDLVWKAFTEPERLKHWWGPKGFTVTAADIDLRSGGRYHYGLRTPDGTEMWGKFDFREIVAPEKMLFINAFSDRDGGTTRHPMSPTWPLELRSVFTFEEAPGGKTRFTVHWSPHEASAEERKTFDESHELMRQGWGGTMDQLAAYLAREQAGTRP